MSSINFNIFCNNCGSRVQQSSNKARTICPYCGNFFQRKLSCQENDFAIISPANKTAANNKKKTMSKLEGEKEKLPWFRLRRKSSSSNNKNLALPALSESRMVKTGGMSPRTGGNTAETRPQTSGSIWKPIPASKSRSNSIDLSKIVTDNLINKEWETMYQNLKEIFATLRSIFFHFHHPNENSDILIEKLKQVFDCIDQMPIEYQKRIMKVIENCLKEFNISKMSNEDLLAIIILLLNPLLDNSEYYSLLIVVVTIFTSFQKKKDQGNTIILLLRLPINSFRDILRRVQNMLTYCLFINKNHPSKEKHVEKWKEKCVKFIAFLNAANDRQKLSATKINYTEFYNCSLDEENLPKYYSIWIDSKYNDFSYCQYPCVLSINAKKTIFQYESEKQMVVLAKQTLITSMRNHEVPDLDLAFLNLSVRRNHLVLDSVNEILSKRGDLKKKLKVKFIGEPGLDMGGLTKEWFLLLLRQILNSKASVFYYDPHYRLNWFLRVPRERDYTEFYLTGVLMGLAVYNSINLDVRFPLICYKKLLSPSVCNESNKNIGICPVNLGDLASVYPDLACGLRELLVYEGNVETDICANFEISYQNYAGETIHHNLKPNGSKISVTNTNRKEYVNLYCHFLLNILIEAEFKAFYQGFHTVCESNALMLLRAEEVETLVCGSAIFDIIELQKVVVYDGYSKLDKTIILFWEVLCEFTESLQKLFLHFTTGSDRIPAGGMQDMQLKISKTNNRKRLPMAYTCFNQLLLPAYNDRNELKLKLLIAMENSEGFGLK